MNLLNVKNLVLDRCQFSKSGYSFEFSGHIDGEYTHLKLSTSYCVSFSEDELIDSGKNFSVGAWDLVEKTVSDIIVNEDESTEENSILKLGFEGGGAVIICFGDLPPMDNLAILEDMQSKNWISIL